MAWWRRPNTTVAMDMAEVAMAGMDFGLEDTLATTVAPPFRDETSKNITNWIGEIYKIKMECGHYQKYDGKIYISEDLTTPVTFWTEGVLSLCVAIFGLIGNFLSIFVLSVPEMRSTAFNRLLLALALIGQYLVIPN